MFGMIAEKLGMTQVYDKEGSSVAVTVVRIQPNVVTEVKTRDKHGYNAVQLAHHEQKEHRVNKAKAGHYKKNNLKVHSHLKEFTTDRSGDYKIGMTLNAAYFQAGDVLDVQGTSKGKGFQGVMKRHNFSGGRDSHGASVSHRVPGSIGMNSYPGRVIPGKKMAGHMGDRTVTVKNVEIVATEPEQNIILVKGALPGSRNSMVYLYAQQSDLENRILTATPAQEKAQEETKAQEA